MSLERDRRILRSEKPLPQEVFEERDVELFTVIKNAAMLVEGVTESLIDEGVSLDNGQRLCFVTPTQEEDSARVIVLALERNPNDVVLDTWETTYKSLEIRFDDLIQFKRATFQFMPKNLEDIEQLKRTKGIISLREQRRAFNMIDLGNLRGYGWNNGRRISLGDRNGTDIINEANDILLQVPASRLINIITPQEISP